MIQSHCCTTLREKLDDLHCQSHKRIAENYETSQKISDYAMQPSSHDCVKIWHLGLREGFVNSHLRISALKDRKH